MAGPMTNADRENMAAKTSSPTAGATQLPNFRCMWTSTGMDASSPSAPNSAVPPDPATSGRAGEQADVVQGMGQEPHHQADGPHNRVPESLGAVPGT